jgi:prevent-host-death family protein
MIHQFSYAEAKRRLRDLIDAAMRGETVLITHGDQKTVQLVPVAEAKPRPQFGSAKGLIQMADDFDEPLEDFAEKINAAYSDAPDPDERLRRQKMRRIQKSLVEGELNDLERNVEWLRLSL